MEPISHRGPCVSEQEAAGPIALTETETGVSRVFCLWPSVHFTCASHSDFHAIPRFSVSLLGIETAALTCFWPGLVRSTSDQPEQPTGHRDTGGEKVAVKAWAAQSRRLCTVKSLKS